MRCGRIPMILAMLSALAAPALTTPSLAQQNTPPAAVAAPEGGKVIKPPKAPRPPKADGPVCYNVWVELLATGPKGKAWDPWPGKRGRPDPVIRELTTGAGASCVDNFTCGLRLTAKGGLQFIIEDDDPDASDPVGSGACTAGKDCKVGRANISFSRC